MIIGRLNEVRVLMERYGTLNTVVGTRINVKVVAFIFGHNSHNVSLLI